MPIIPRRQKQQIAFTPKANQIAVPAPTGGVNTRDSRSDMDIRDAITMENWIPESNGVRSRSGYTTFGTVATGDVETLIPYEYAAVQQLISFAGTVMYKTGTGGGAGTSIQTSLTNARWQSAQLGQNMLFVNGVDAPLNFDGTTVTTPTFTGDLATTGEETMDGAHSFKDRIYMWDSDTSDFYYGDTSAVSGDFTKFQLGTVATSGGNLLIMETLSRDAGDGMDDFAVFILTTGEVIMYQGSNPGDATNWSLIGKYFMSPPVSIRSAARFAGDIVVITRNDVLSVGNVIKSGGGQEGGQGFNLNPSKMSGGIQDDFAVFGTNYGFEIQLYGSAGWILINIPETTNSTYHQWVVSTTTGAATKFIGWDAQVFAVFNNRLYFGQSVNIFQADSGLDDNGSDIQLREQQAFNDFQDGHKKNFTGYKLFVRSEGTLNIGVSFAFDYGTPSFPATSQSQVSGATWDDASWDTAEWAGTNISRLVNFGTGGEGVTVSPLVSIDVSGQEVFLYNQLYNFTVSNTF